MSAALSLDSLLCVAIIEQRAQQQRAQQSLAALSTAPFVDSLALSQLGQNYEEHLVQSKIRALAAAAAPIDNAALAAFAPPPLPPPPSQQPNAAAANLLNLFDAAQLSTIAGDSIGNSRLSSPHLGGGTLAAPTGGAQLSSASAPNTPPIVLLPASGDKARKRSAGALGVAPMLTSRAANAAGSHSTRQSRFAHNLLEKNRRANLRSYLDRLKASLPADAESSRSTTLSLLTQARNYIRTLNRQKQTLDSARDATAAENARLRARLALLKAQSGDVVESADQQQTTMANEMIVDVQSAPSSVVQPSVAAAAAFHMPPIAQTLAPTLIKPEPQRLAPTSNEAAALFELSPSAKPLLPTSTALLPRLSTAELLRALVALQQQSAPIVAPPPPAPTASAGSLLYTPFRSTPIDLMTEGLTPSTPFTLLYPYTCQQQNATAASNAF